MPPPGTLSCGLHDYYISTEGQHRLSDIFSLAYYWLVFGERQGFVSHLACL